MPADLTLLSIADAQLVDLWPHGRDPHAQRAYRADVARFGASVGKPLVEITLGDLQAFADSLTELAPTSQVRILSAVKSMRDFGSRSSELCDLTWRDPQERGDAGQLAVCGKGGKTRVVLLSATTWRELTTLRDDAGVDKPMPRAPSSQTCPCRRSSGSGRSKPSSLARTMT